MKKRNDNFFKFIAISFAFHLVVFILLTVKILFFPSEDLSLQSAVRIDVVALPDKILRPPTPQAEKKKPEPISKEEPKPAVKKEEPKAKPKPKPKKKVVNLAKKKKKKKKTKVKETKSEQDSALARLKAMQKLKKKSTPAKQEFKGNAATKGNSLTGLDKLSDDSYKSKLENHIKSHWVLPEWLRDGNYKASIVVLISRTGSITNKTFVVTSGNKLFDDQVLSTLEKANPLPKPPDRLIDLYSNKGVRVNFP